MELEFLVCEADPKLFSPGELEAFEGEDGKGYFYKVKFDLETISIIDTVGRKMFLGVEDLEPMIEILRKIHMYNSNMIGVTNYVFNRFIEGTVQPLS